MPITGVRGYEQFPLNKGGSAEGAGVVLRGPKDSGGGMQGLRSPKLQDNPLALRAAPFVKGEFLRSSVKDGPFAVLDCWDVSGRGNASWT